MKQTNWIEEAIKHDPSPYDRFVLRQLVYREPTRKAFDIVLNEELNKKNFPYRIGRGTSTFRHG